MNIKTIWSAYQKSIHKAFRRNIAYMTCPERYEAEVKADYERAMAQREHFGAALTHKIDELSELDRLIQEVGFVEMDSEEGKRIIKFVTDEGTR